MQSHTHRRWLAGGLALLLAACGAIPPPAHEDMATGRRLQSSVTITVVRACAGSADLNTITTA